MTRAVFGRDRGEGRGHAWAVGLAAMAADSGVPVWMRALVATIRLVCERSEAYGFWRA